jgi:hypothetical protein
VRAVGTKLPDEVVERIDRVVAGVVVWPPETGKV